MGKQQIPYIQLVVLILLLITVYFQYQTYLLSKERRKILPAYKTYGSGGTRENR